MFNKPKIMEFKSKISFFLAAVGVLMLSVGCTKDDVQQVPVIELSDEVVVLTETNLEATYQFKVFNYTDGMPIVKSDVDWLTFQDIVKAESGENFQSFQFKMTAVLREGLSSAEVKVTYKDAEPKRVTVEQDNLPIPVIKLSDEYGREVKIGFVPGREIMYKFGIENYSGGYPEVTKCSDEEWLLVGEPEKLEAAGNIQYFQCKMKVGTVDDFGHDIKVEFKYKNASIQHIKVLHPGVG